MKASRSIKCRIATTGVNMTMVAVLLLYSLGSSADEAEFENGTETGWSVRNWTIQTSLYTRHFDPDPEHVEDQNMVAVEAAFANGWTFGAAVFVNSYDQDSQLVFAARKWPVFHSEFWYIKLMGGLLHGYKEPYQDKIPFNGLGIAPVVIPALGFNYKYFVAEATLGGLAVVTVTAGVRF